MRVGMLVVVVVVVAGLALLALLLSMRRRGTRRGFDVLPPEDKSDS